MNKNCKEVSSKTNQNLIDPLCGHIMTYSGNADPGGKLIGQLQIEDSLNIKLNICCGIYTYSVNAGCATGVN